MEPLDLRYPIGKVSDIYSNEEYDEKIKDACLRDISNLPGLLEHAILNLDEHQLNTTYRPGGWTVKQVVHHVADSHINAYCRFRLGLTEEHPTIRGYEEAAWAELQDARNMPVNISLTLLHALHRRWSNLLESMTEEQWQRLYFHPEHKKSAPLWKLAQTYSWHGRHHTAHITSLRERMGW